MNSGGGYGGAPSQQHMMSQQYAYENSPTYLALQQNAQSDWGEDTPAGSGIRHLVESEQRKKTPVLDYAVPLVSPDYQSVTTQVSCSKTYCQQI